MNKILTTNVYSITALSVCKDKVVNIEVQGMVTETGNGNVILTGNLGSSAYETMLVAKTVCRYKHKKFNSFNYHLHFGYPSVKKDGPSWGLSCYILLSWLSGALNYKNAMAATGEIDLKGNIKPVLYLNEKIASWAANEVGCIIIPKITDQILTPSVYSIEHVDELSLIMNF